MFKDVKEGTEYIGIVFLPIMNQGINEAIEDGVSHNQLDDDLVGVGHVVEYEVAFLPYLLTPID